MHAPGLPLPVGWQPVAPHAPPAHAALQQALFAPHAPDKQSWPLPPPTQVPPAETLFLHWFEPLQYEAGLVAQPESLLHVVAQAKLPLPAQRYGVHDTVEGVTQVPVPLHVFGPVYWLVPVLQLWLPHEVPAGQKAHAPAPSHIPVKPHVEAADAAQSLCGSLLALAAPQVPSEPLSLSAAAHAWHGPQAATLQHTPSVQWPDAHIASREHAPPTSLVTHCLALLQK